MSSNDNIRPVGVQWKALGALTIKFYQDGNLVAGEFRARDEYEMAMPTAGYAYAKTTSFKIVADYGNGEV